MEKAILVNLATTKKEKEEAHDSMAELAGLASADGAKVVGTVFQNRPRASARSFLGDGQGRRGQGTEETARGRASSSSTTT